MNGNKYLVGLIGLALGFIVGYFATQSMNKNAGGATGGSGSTGPQSSAGGQQTQQGMMANVQATIEKARNSPTDYQAQIDVARVYNQIGRADETVEYLLKAYEIDPVETGKLGAFPFVGQWYFEKKNYDQAEVWFRRALEVDSSEPDVYVILAEALNLRTPPEPDKAIKELELALKINPTNSHALVHLLDAYLLKKDARLADETLNRLTAAEPTNLKIASYQTAIADLKAGRPVTLPKERPE
ncbi:MAG TPA: hypothetical protein VJH03_09260 [Blastocatellia bacterium]|nr:hypothetical protein [Blastocatellia bacterium]